MYTVSLSCRLQQLDLVCEYLAWPAENEEVRATERAQHTKATPSATLLM